VRDLPNSGPTKGPRLTCLCGYFSFVPKVGEVDQSGQLQAIQRIALHGEWISPVSLHDAAKQSKSCSCPALFANKATGLFG
jgi:hypothetical protein